MKVEKLKSEKKKKKKKREKEKEKKSVKGGIASSVVIAPDLNQYIIIPFMRSNKDISTMCSNISNNWIKVYLYYHL